MSTEPWRVISIRQPLAWLVMSTRPERKDVENREWGPAYGARRYLEQTGRQRVWIHASAGGSRLEQHEALADAIAAGFPREALPPLSRIPLGAILGSVQIDAWGEDFDSPWFMGPWGIRMVDPRPLDRVIPARGALGFWSPKPALAVELLARQAA